jgi:putative oxidoreductase
MNEPTHPLVSLINWLYDLLVWLGNHSQSYLLGFIRWIFGVELFMAGMGHLTHIPSFTSFFMDLKIPFPAENAWLVAFTETGGGLLLSFGLLSRLICIPLTINFIVAFLTTEQKGIGEIFSSFSTDDFAADTAFPYFATALIVLIFGPGALSLDYLICLWRKKEWRGPKL